ncbi:MAG: hypothetical protein ACRDLR_08420 [Gaiellaceae bacterium]
MRLVAGRLIDASRRQRGDVDDALRDVGSEDAVAVLGGVARQLSVLVAVQKLRDVEPAADAEEPTVEDDELPADPWRTGDVGIDALEEGRRLHDALASQRTVQDLFRAVGALDETELWAIVFAAALRAMAERRRPG